MAFHKEETDKIMIYFQYSDIQLYTCLQLDKSRYSGGIFSMTLLSVLWVYCPVARIFR